MHLAFLMHLLFLNVRVFYFILFSIVNAVCRKFCYIAAIFHFQVVYNPFLPKYFCGWIIPCIMKEDFLSASTFPVVEYKTRKQARGIRLLQKCWKIGQLFNMIWQNKKQNAGSITLPKSLNCMPGEEPCCHSTVRRCLQQGALNRTLIMIMMIWYYKSMTKIWETAWRSGAGIVPD